MVGERGQPRSNQPVFNVRLGRPDVGRHAAPSLRQSLEGTTLKANVPSQRQVFGGGLEVLNGARQHGAALTSVLVDQSGKGRREKFRKNLKPLRRTVSVRWDVRDEGGPGALGFGQACRRWHAAMERIEHGVFSRNRTLIEGFLCEAHGLRNVAIVMVTTKKAASLCAFWMRSLDLNAPHGTTVSPGFEDFPVVKEVIKTEETQPRQIVQCPLFQPGRMALQVLLGHRYGSVVVDDQLVVCGEANVKFDAVKHGKGVLEAFQRVFRGGFPRAPFLHASTSVRSPSKVIAGGEGMPLIAHQSVRRHKARFHDAKPWTPMKS